MMEFQKRKKTLYFYDVTYFLPYFENPKYQVESTKYIFKYGNI